MELADVQVYPRALSAGDVSALWNKTRGGGVVTTGALTTTWKRDQRGLPVSVTDPDGKLTGYVYDEAGRLAVTEAPAVVPYVQGVTTYYDHDAAGETTAVTDGAQNGTSTYTWAPDGTLTATGVAGGTPAQGVLDWTDVHTDVAGQFKPAGTALTASAAYDPWGNGVAWAGSGQGALGYQSQYTDPATGLTEMGARWYRPSTGGFTSRDTMIVPPVPDPAAANPFAYAAGDPLGAIDPTGHTSIYTPDIAIPRVYDTTALQEGGGWLSEGDPGGSLIRPGLEGARGGMWANFGKLLAAVAVAASAIYALSTLAGEGGSGTPGAGGGPGGAGTGRRMCAGAPDGYYGGCSDPTFINDGGGGGAPPPWWTTYRHSQVHYGNHQAPAGNSSAFSRAAVDAAIKDLAAFLALAGIGRGGGGPGGLPPGTSGAGGSCGADGGPQLPDPPLLPPGQDNKQQQGGQSFTAGT